MSDIIKDINEQLEQYRQARANIPGVATITRKPDYMVPVIRMVQINTDLSAGEIYSVGGGKYAFAQLAMLKFMQAGRIEFDSSSHRGTRVDDRRDPNTIEVKVVGKRFDMDGVVQCMPDEKKMDLQAREAAMRYSYETKINGDNPKMPEDKKKLIVEKKLKEYMLQLRKFAHEIAVSGAQARVITKLLGLKKAYTIDELKKPFIIISLIPEVDMSDPAIKQMVTAHMLGIKDLLYPTAAGITSTYMPHESVPIHPEVGDILPEFEGEADKAKKAEVIPFETLPHESPAQPVAINRDVLDFTEYPLDVQVDIVEKMMAGKGITPMKPLKEAGEDEIFNLYKQLICPPLAKAV